MIIPMLSLMVTELIHDGMLANRRTCIMVDVDLEDLNAATDVQLYEPKMCIPLLNSLDKETKRLHGVRAWALGIHTDSAGGYQPMLNY